MSLIPRETCVTQGGTRKQSIGPERNVLGTLSDFEGRKGEIHQELLARALADRLFLTSHNRIQDWQTLGMIPVILIISLRTICFDILPPN